MAMALLPALVLAAIPHGAAACEARITRSGGTLVFDGCISADAAEVFVGALRQPTRDVVVRSTGGAVGPALDMAEALAASGAALTVAGWCASSCANYLLTAAAVSRVPAEAAIVFHGDAGITWQQLQAPGQPPLPPPARAAIEALVTREQAFQTRYPRAADVHRRQAAMLHPAGASLADLGAPDCSGHGRTTWRPSAGLLLRLGLVDEVPATGAAAPAAGPALPAEVSPLGAAAPGDAVDPGEACPVLRGPAARQTPQTPEMPQTPPAPGSAAGAGAPPEPAALSGAR
ncbi:hypothetical protein [Piscinibacter sakaiensis]|uniref:Periplasmic protein n=1 Tax=Piscinibacter sakaiensis TaxID=1547922 RepID=A0A0K8P450_PISS1|nr:hypothetical protein [Piscinibacter sakaiensis]GAP37413.1 hypothetical protein ISF6_3268 [Piscinibacter sakaiensis]